MNTITSTPPSTLAPSTLELLFRRKASHSLPGKRREDFNLALVLEGGGMRGCVAAGMGAALSRLRYVNCFDQVIATSSGAMKAPYFLSNQAVAHAPVYATDIAKGRFISIWRAFHGNRPIMDLDYLLRHILVNIRPLEFGRIAKRGIPLHLTATIADTGQAVLLSDFKDQEELFTAMRASALIPGVGGHAPVNFRGMNLIDGGYSAFLPEKLARQNGATHLLMLTNLPAESYHRKPDRNHVRTVGSALASLSSPVAESFLTNHERDNEQLARIRSGEDPTIGHCEMPEDGPHIDTLCRKPKVIWQGLEAGFKAMCRYMDQPNRQIPRQWKNLQKAKQKPG